MLMLIHIQLSTMGSVFGRGCALIMEESPGSMPKAMDGGKSVSQFFFERADPPGEGATEVVHKGDYTPLLRAIAHLPTAAIEFKAPDEKVMATAFAEMLGMEIDD